MVLKCRSPGSYDADAESLRTGQDDGGMPSLTVQDQREDADINVILKRFGITGELPVSQRVPLEIVDVDEVLDYRTCVDRVMNANKAFAAQPASVRNRFNNDPAAFVEFFMDDANREEAEKLGLVAPRAQALGAPIAAPAASSGGT